MDKFSGFIAVMALSPIILFVVLGVMVLKKKARRRANMPKR